jgi:hypothetical protein
LFAAFAAIGAISYGLYVVHYPILFDVKARLPGSWTAVLLAVPLSFAAAAVLECAPRLCIPRWSGRISDVACCAGANVLSAERGRIAQASEASPRRPAMGLSGRQNVPIDDVDRPPAEVTLAMRRGRCADEVPRIGQNREWPPRKTGVLWLGR